MPNQSLSLTDSVALPLHSLEHAACVRDALNAGHPFELFGESYHIVEVSFDARSQFGFRGHFRIFRVEPVSAGEVINMPDWKLPA